MSSCVRDICDLRIATHLCCENKRNITQRKVYIKTNNCLYTAVGQVLLLTGINPVSLGAVSNRTQPNMRKFELIIMDLMCAMPPNDLD